MTISRREPTEIEKLSEAFAPCTPKGLAAELWRLNVEIGRDNAALAAKRRERDNVEAVLLNAMLTKMEEDVIEGDHPPLRLVWDYEYNYTSHTADRVPGITFDRETPTRIADWAEKKRGKSP